MCVLFKAKGKGLSTKKSAQQVVIVVVKTVKT